MRSRMLGGTMRPGCVAGLAGAAATGALTVRRLFVSRCWRVGRDGWLGTDAMGEGISRALLLAARWFFDYRLGAEFRQ